jgi:predicted TIM-barrel fold metal-dependent hydrolase
MKRRTFVAGAGVIAGASWLAAGVPEDAGDSRYLPAPGTLLGQAEKTSKGHIDIHHHGVPNFYTQALSERGLGNVAGLSITEWSAQRSLALMDANGIQTAILSLPAPGAWLGRDDLAVQLARRSNEFYADLGQRHPGRFGSFASVPLPATEQACAQAIYALDTLKADGIVLLASNAGVYLGDPRFDELMAELHRRQATVFVHPNLHPSSSELGLPAPPYMVEFACDLTRAAVNLMLSGTMERYPHIRWILAHGGGFLPYAAWRVSLANALPQLQEKAPQGVMTYLQRFYFDTALVTSAPSMAVLAELVEPSRLLFGSDYPTLPAELIRSETAALKTASPWSPAQVAAMHRGNALSLFSRYAAPGEWVQLAPLHQSESTRQWLARAARKPLGAIAQRLKD